MAPKLGSVVTWGTAKGSRVTIREFQGASRGCFYYFYSLFHKSLLVLMIAFRESKSIIAFIYPPGGDHNSKNIM